MSTKYFLDTNVFLYADDRDAGPKQDVAFGIIESAISSGKGVVSTQVLQEYYVNATRKLGINPDDVKRKIELICRLDVVRIRVEDILDAIDLHRFNQLSFWDALIVRCAAAAGCNQILTEDLQHGQILAGVKIENPFREVE